MQVLLMTNLIIGYLPVPTASVQTTPHVDTLEQHVQFHRLLEAQGRYGVGYQEQDKRLRWHYVVEKAAAGIPGCRPE